LESWKVGALLSGVLLLPAFAQEPATRRIELAKTPAAQILEEEGNTVRVSGFVESTQVNATGIHFLRFRDSEFTCVTFARHVKDFPGGPPSEAYKEKWIEVTGLIENYRGKPQIKLTLPDQVKIIEAPAPPPVAQTPPPAKPPVDAPDKEAGKPKTGDPAPVVKAPEAKPGRVVEIIDGVEALDWRKYFPE